MLDIPSYLYRRLKDMLVKQNDVCISTSRSRKELNLDNLYNYIGEPKKQISWYKNNAK